MAGFVFGVADRKKDDIPFIALNRFEVFDEKRFFFAGKEGLFEAGIVFSDRVDRVINRILLRFAESNDSEGTIGIGFGQTEEQLGGFLRLDWVIAALPFVNAFGDVMGMDPVLIPFDGVRETIKRQIINQMVREGDQALVLAAVVPKEPLGRQSPGGEVENGLAFLVVLSKLLFVFFFGGFHGEKEARRRKLMLIAYDDRFLAPIDGSESIFRENLRGLIKDHEIKGGVGGEIAGDGKRRHQEKGLEVVDGSEIILEQVADGHDLPFLFVFMENFADHGIHVGLKGGRPTFRKPFGDLVTADPILEFIQFFEMSDERRTIILGEMGQNRGERGLIIDFLEQEVFFVRGRDVLQIKSLIKINFKEIGERSLVEFLEEKQGFGVAFEILFVGESQSHIVFEGGEPERIGKRIGGRIERQKKRERFFEGREQRQEI